MPARGKYDKYADELTAKKWIWENRILPKLIKNGDCWEWRGCTSFFGYGQVRFTYQCKQVITSTHRIALEIKRGALLGELLSLHKCDNPACNNPDHLFEGTQKDNSLDCKAKGRMRGVFKKGHIQVNPQLGSQKYNAKLSESIVYEARKIYASGEMGHKLIAKRYSISYHAMRAALKGWTWKHVPMPQQQAS